MWMRTKGALAVLKGSSKIRRGFCAGIVFQMRILTLLSCGNSMHDQPAVEAMTLCHFLHIRLVCSLLAFNVIVSTAVTNAHSPIAPA
jgi:hypothetical protein